MTEPEKSAELTAREALPPTTEGQFRRSMGLVSNFSLGFTYLSPLAGTAALLPLALTTAGPPAIWWLVIVAIGQLMVALVFGEVVSQYPITGGIYPWARRLWGRRYAWLAAWVYLCALLVTVTTVAEFAAPYVGSLFGFVAGRGETLLVASSLLLLALVLNMSGTKMLARVARIGFFAELTGVIIYGLYLLTFERQNSFGVFFDAMGSAGGDSYTSAFLLAALTGMYLFYGFEACGDVAEEVNEPARQIPKAMVLTIFFGGISAFTAFAGFILAAPNLQSIVDGNVADPMSAILEDATGTTGTKIFLVVALTAFISCVLSLQAAASRLIFSFARDNMLPGSSVLGRLSHDYTPRSAILLACALPIGLCLIVYLMPDSLARITAFGVLGIYLCFQMVVLAALRQRLRGWRPAGPWSLGRFGGAVNVVALAYGIVAMVVLARPGDVSLGFVDRWIVLLGLGTVLVTGAVYMVVARPWGDSDGPEGDALEVAAQLRAEGSEHSVDRA